MRKSFIITSILSSVALATVVVASTSSGTLRSLFKTLANPGSNNTLYLSNQKISTQSSSYSGEISANVYTDNNNPIEFKCANVINNVCGWQTILPGGYFYNPITNSSSHNKITGIESIRFNSNENKNLSLCYGYSLDNENIIYTYEKDLVPNETYSLDGLNPSYLYVKNNNDSNVNITDFNVSYSCVESAYPKQNLNILMIGNSFADDTLYYSENVAKSFGINLNLYDAYIAGCTIDQHYSNLTNDTASYSMRRYVDDEWSYNDNRTLAEIIDSHTWDIITFQQASAEVGRSNKYSNLGNLTSAVRSRVGSNPKFYWHQTWAYDKEYHDTGDQFSYFGNNQMTMFNAICDCYTNQVAPLNVFEKLISNGTAVQNLRSSYMKDTISRDLKHMSSVHGRFLLALNFVSQVYDIDFGKSACTFLPLEVDPSFMNVAYESVKNADKSPLICTNSVYQTRELTGYNLANYIEIDAELLGCSYWNSTDSNNYNKRISNEGGSVNYVSTKRFTQADLPIGSLVLVDDAFGVRPEAWVSDAKQSSRKGLDYSNVIEIDSAFWSGYTYRAFNIFKPGSSSPSLKGMFSQVFDGFHVYVPNSQMGGLTPKSANPNYSDDKNLFMSNGYNIDAYERMHLDPITGFYKCDSYYELTNSYSDDTAKKFLCTRPFYSANGDLPENTVIVVDSGYQWRSDCWGAQNTYSPRPDNVSNSFTILSSSFWSGLRRRTFNVSSINGYYVNQNYISFMNHLRIYVPISDDIEYEEPVPVVPETDFPEGTFSGSATVLGSSYTIVISIGYEGSNLVGVRLANSDAVATSISFNRSTKAVTITTTGSYSGYSYGTITGTYSKSEGKIKNVSCSGSISSYVSNNGNITCTKATSSNSPYFDDCDVATSVLQSRYKRRYMSGSWQVDNSNADRITCNMSEYVGGAASLKRKGYSGGAVALNFNNDFSPAIEVANVQFWVYNPSGSDIELRMWGYKANGFGSNFETGSVTALANSWTYVAMGFTKASIYNFQIADFNSTGVYLSFDNIYLF